MPGTFRKVDPIIKEKILKQAKEDHRPIAEIAEEFSVSTTSIYGWLGKEVDDTGKSASSYLSEIHKLQREKEDLLSIIGSLTVVVERVKKKMKKTDFVREVYEENHKNAMHHGGHEVGYSIFSRIFSIARSSLQYVSLMDIRDEKEKQKLTDIHKEHPWYGHRRIRLTLGWSMKKSRRLMKKCGISAIMKKRRAFIKTGDQKQDDMHGKYIGGTKIINHLKTLCPIHPHVVWRSDFTHIIYQGVHLYLATILDDFTKEIVGYSLSYNHTKEFILRAIEDAIVKTGGIIPQYFHSDQGSEYTSESVMSFLTMNHILISMSTKGSPWQNGAQESYYGKFKLELGDVNQYETREQLILAIHRQIFYYNQRRLHTTIKNTPVGFRQKHEEKARILLSKNTDTEAYKSTSI